MKKCITILTALLLTVALAVSVFAAQGIVTLESTTAQPGHTVFLKVAVTESLAGDTVGITYSFDEKQLEVLPESCKWEKTGILQDFSHSDNIGVWGSSDVVDLYGTVCVLAFRVRSDAKIADTKVGCTLKVKHGAEEVGSFTAEATVEIVCGHTYGQWESSGNLFHKRVCSICGDVQNQSHTWDDGTVSPGNQADMDIKTYHCSVCGGTKQQEIPKQTEETATQPTTHPVVQPTQPTESSRPDPTLPTVTKPTQPTESSRPTQPSQSAESSRPDPTVPTVTQPSQPTESSRPTQPGNSDQPTQSTPNHTPPATIPATQDNEGSNDPGGSETHAHESETQAATEHPEQEHGTTEQTAAPNQDPHAGHDHGDENVTPAADENERLLVASSIFLVLGGFLAVSALIARKKHK